MAKRKRSGSKRYVLRLSRDHLETVATACEVYSRVRGGQVEAIHMATDCQYSANFREQVVVLKHIMFPDMHPHASMGIGHDAAIDSAYEVYKSINHRLSWDDRPAGGPTVNFDLPLDCTGDIPLVGDDDEMIENFDRLRDLAHKLGEVRAASDFADDATRLKAYDDIVSKMDPPLKAVAGARRDRSWKF